ncbi:MAG TPA: DUF1015 domain-containing protein [Dehalococcoidia bacterium]|jgi:uncharacterized protein (DUF1015 family)|nr:DUF1015 domain-containing protein [Dehalococcoidia bacterium]
MADVRPFRGLRYDPARAGDLGRLIAPPFDVISPAQQRALHDASPYNAVHLEANLAPGAARYSTAATLLREWLGSGVLHTEREPAFYLYEQSFRRGGRGYRRRAVFARVRLEPFERGIVRPHEYTLSGPKEDRLQLLRATRTNISPVFCLYRSDAANPLARLALAEGAPGCVHAVDSAGDQHALAPVLDPEAQQRIAAYLRPRTLYIADGHHRYETALRYRDERHAQAPSWTGDEPENFVLMGLTAADDAGLLILPIHRLVQRPADEAALGRIRQYFSLQEIEGDAGAPETLRAALAAQQAAPDVAFVAAGLQTNRLTLLTLRDRAAVETLMPAERSPAWKGLDVSALQYGVLEAGLGIDLDAIAAGGIVEFTEDAEEAVAAVRTGRVPLALLVRPTRAEDIFAVADAGDRMPQKSTYFYPKLGTGLVFRSLDSDAN